MDNNAVKRGHIVRIQRSGWIWRPITPEELRAWEDSPDSKGIGEDGETRLPPRYSSERGDGTKLFKVMNSRVRARRGYHDIPHCVVLEDEKGVLWYTEKKDLE